MQPRREESRGRTIVCTYFDENFLNLVPAEQVEGRYGCLDYYRGVDDPFSIDLLETAAALAVDYVAENLAHRMALRESHVGDMLWDE